MLDEINLVDRLCHSMAPVSASLIFKS